MPMHFDRFRLLDNSRRIRNESEKPLYLMAYHGDEPFILGPGQEDDIPVSEEGETIVEILNPE